MPVAKVRNSIACIIEGDNLLLYRRINTSYEPNKLGLVGGKIEGDETPTSAMVREIREETSLIVSEDDLTLLTSLAIEHEQQDHLTHIFLVHKWAGEPRNLEPEKCGGLHWHPLRELPDEVIPVVHDIVRLIP